MSAKNFLFNVRGPSGVVVLVSWLAAVVAICLWADGTGRLIGVGFLSYFIAAYFTAANRQIP